jgi:hypothetical protein
MDILGFLFLCTVAWIGGGLLGLALSALYERMNSIRVKADDQSQLTRSE